MMDESEIRDGDDRLEPEGPPVRPASETTGIPWAAVFILLWAVLLIIFSVQNADTTPVEFLGWSIEVPVALLVMITALVTLVLTGLASFFYRRKRRRRHEEKQALREKRARQDKRALESDEPPSQ